MRTLDLAGHDIAMVSQILRSIVPMKVRVYAFGSRATGQARRGSDLDLALDAGERLDWKTLARLRGAFTDSVLSIEVDVVDLNALDANFRARIDADLLDVTDRFSAETA